MREGWDYIDTLLVPDGSLSLSAFSEHRLATQLYHGILVVPFQSCCPGDHGVVFGTRVPGTNRWLALAYQQQSSPGHISQPIWLRHSLTNSSEGFL